MESLSKKIDHNISVERVQISWMDRVVLHDLLILDKKSDTLFFSEHIVVNYRIKDLLNKELLNIEEISSEGVRLQLIKHDPVSRLNISELIESLKRLAREESRPLTVEEINVTNVEFSLHDRTKKKTRDQLDFSHLDMIFFDLLVADLEVIKDSVEMTVIHVRADEKNEGLQVLDFSTSISFNNTSLSLTNLRFDTPTSHISDRLALYYNDPGDLIHFVDSVSFVFHLSESSISKEDIKLFIGDHHIKSNITLDGTIWGTVADFNVEQSRIGFGKESFIEGGASCLGLPDFKGTFVLADITGSHIVPEDIEPYVGELSKNLSQLGRCDFTGSFAGFLNDFVARGDFVTEKGSIHSDINLKIPSDPANMKYSGNVELKNVDIGAFLNNTDLIQKVNLKGKIKGEGITPENANFTLNAIAFDSGFKGYVYDSIRADGTFASNFFKGNFSIDDPNCQANGYADMELNREEEIMKLKLTIDAANLNKLNLIMDDTLVTGGNINVDIVNLDPDKFIGEARIDSGFLNINGEQLLIDSVKFTASLSNGMRQFNLTLPGVEARLEGKFKITDALKDLSVLAEDYAAKIQLSRDTINEERSGESYKMDFFAHIDNLSRYLDALHIPLEIPDGSFIEASFRESKNANIFVYAQADYIKIKNQILYHPALEVNGSREVGTSGMLTHFILESDRQKFSRVSETENLLIEGVWADNNIKLTSSLKHEDSKSNFRLETRAVLSKGAVTLKINPSEIIAFGEKWSFNPQNLIVIHQDHWKISDLALHDATESIGLHGTYSRNKGAALSLNIVNLNLNKMNLFTEADVEGWLDGDLNIFRSRVDQAFQFDGGFEAKNLTLDNFLVGTVTCDAKWNADTKSVYSQFEVDSETLGPVDCRGSYYPFKKNNQLDFELKFEQVDLQLAQPFLKNNISNLSGGSTGTLNIFGSPADPLIMGKCMISNGRLTVNYLNTDYTFSGEVKLEPKQLKFENFDLEDRKGSRASIRGVIAHDFFENFIARLTIDANNFEFLNTSATDNSLYYGSAHGTGSVDISGPLNDVVISAFMKTENGTQLFVPIATGGEVSQQEYITFVDANGSTTNKVNDEYALRGFTLDFDIEVTPDAYCELIFDIKTGDIIKGRGSGNIKLALDTDGGFNMFGPLEITEGTYNFTVPGFINKAFKVNPASRITWLGDPYSAIIDLNATYLQRASFEDLKTVDEQDEAEVSTKVPVNVMLNLDGSMTSPAIGFDLQLVDEVDVTEERNALLDQIVNDEQELRRQVISLLFFKKFSPRFGLAIEGGNLGSSLLSEYFSSQMSYLLSQLDENLEVEVDLASLDQDAFNTFQLQLAYTFMDGRLKVMRGGGFVNGQRANERVLDNIVGDWSVEYNLARGGWLRSKIFSTTNQQLTVSRGDQSQDRGFSLRFVRSFNDFKELFFRHRKVAIRRKEDELQPAENNDLNVIY